MYVDALVIFSSAKKCVLGDDSPSITLALRELVASSAVILLANPAHLTALNARKRLIQGRHRDPRRELEYIAALLSSRNCANQSVLWHHRQWLLRRIYGLPDDFLQPSSDVEVSSSTLSQDVINNEFSIASKACSIYPRNYFGWSHRHFCIQLVFYVLASAADPTYVEELTMLLSDEVVFMRRWIEQHISDSSAVHYLTTLLRRLDDAGLMDAVPFTLPSTPDNAAPTWAKGLSSSVDHAISLVQSYPDHESLWLYLRAGSCQGETQTRDIQSLSRSFIYPWACQSLSPSGYDSRQVTIHAYRFLAWLAFKVSRSLSYTLTWHRHISSNVPEGGSPYHQ